MFWTCLQTIRTHQKTPRHVVDKLRRVDQPYQDKNFLRPPWGGHENVPEIVDTALVSVTRLLQDVTT